MSNNTMVFARHFINALFNGASRELLKQRYPEWDFEIDEAQFVLKKKVAKEVLPSITPAGQKTSKPVDLKITPNDELAAATAVATAASHALAPVSPLVPVE